MEHYLLIALWVIKRTAQYALSEPEIVIVLPWEAEAHCMVSSSLPSRLQLRLVELSAFGCKYKAGVGAWGMQDHLSQMK